MIVLFLAESVSAAEPKPYLFGCGRFISLWAERPRSYDEQIWDHMVNIGVTITGTGLAWVDVEYNRGQYDWGTIDYTDFSVDGIRSRGMEVGFFLGLTPMWAALRPDLPPHRTPPGEEFVDEFMEFHRFVADRYKGRVKYYYFWNEPSGCGWINDGCDNADGYALYTKWLIRCSQAIKSMDPDAKMMGGMLDGNPWEYVQGMYDNGAGPWIDGIALHPYGSPLNWQAIRDVRRVMVQYGDAAKPIWLTEYGWNWERGSEEQLAAYLTTVLTELQKPEWDYVQMANYLVLNDGEGVEGYGLTDADLNPRLRYNVFRDFPKDIPTPTATPTGPTPTPTLTRTPTHTPTVTPTPLPGRLRNGDFEEGFIPAPPEFQDDPDHPRVAAIGWKLWGLNWWKDSGPEGTTYRSPSNCQSLGTNWKTLDNALYQRIWVIPGTAYRASAWTYMEVEVPAQGSLWCALGLDPSGGTDPTAGSVVYGPQNWTEDTWQRNAVETQAQGNWITVFLRAKTVAIGGWEWFHVDDVVLEQIPTPPTPIPGTGRGSWQFY